MVSTVLRCGSIVPSSGTCLSYFYDLKVFIFFESGVNGLCRGSIDPSLGMYLVGLFS